MNIFLLNALTHIRETIILSINQSNLICKALNHIYRCLKVLEIDPAGPLD